MSLVKGINPGRLKHRVTIMRYQETEDELGNTVYELAPLKTCWAELRPIRGKEQLEYYKSVNDLMYKVTIRRTDVTEKDVILFRGRQFQINLHHESSGRQLLSGTHVYRIKGPCSEGGGSWLMFPMRT